MPNKPKLGLLTDRSGFCMTQTWSDIKDINSNLYVDTRIFFWFRPEPDLDLNWTQIDNKHITLFTYINIKNVQNF